MNRELAESIGRTLRAAREGLQLTPEQAAERINISAEVYASIERGQSMPNMVTLARMVFEFGISADTMLGLE
ncbi:MAG: helix-turn-helix domain-containing protein [Proteobacteria bacterium]|nr:helix-turn-helix domain-containing protein [Pseudomonadota bacterium]